jgi:hypothetical protein
MFKFHGKVIIAIIILLSISLACSLSGNNAVGQSVSVSNNPKPSGLLNCSVTVSVISFSPPANSYSNRLSEKHLVHGYNG